MHKGVILLVKAVDRDDAISQVESFLEPYGNGNVWDWYAIGGRWNNTLAPKELFDQFIIEVDNNILKKEAHGFIGQNQVDEKQGQLQKAWEDLGLKGKNPHCNHYNLPDEGNVYDAVPLSECLPTVKEWVRNLEKAADEEFEELVKARDESKEKKAKGEKHWDMSAYHAKNYSNAVYGYFCFDSNVYDIEAGEGEKLPENIDGYWAVMVDLHN